jgi:glycosyltransferase involved in cell wall biosynthesis
MKVAMVGLYPEPGEGISGGVERVVDTLLAELGKELDLTLVVPGAAADGERRVHGCRVVYLKRPPGPGSVRYWTLEARQVASAVAALRPDLVHVQNMAGSGRLIQGPRLLTIHGFLDLDMLAKSTDRSLRSLPRRLAARMVREAERSGRRHLGNVIVINPYVLEEAPEVRSLRTYAIPNPVDRVYCGPQPAGVARRPNILAIGRIAPRKNTLEIIRIAAGVMAARPDVTLTLCGGPASEAYLQACREAARTAGVASRVIERGNLDPAGLIAELDSSSLLMMASRQETAPVVIGEANARGVPVIAPEAYGIRYMITPGENGFFLPAGDLATQGAAVARALDHSWDRAAIRKAAIDLYAPEQVAQRTLEAYRDVLSRAG